MCTPVPQAAPGPGPRQQNAQHASCAAVPQPTVFRRLPLSLEIAFAAASLAFVTFYTALDMLNSRLMSLFSTRDE